MEEIVEHICNKHNIISLDRFHLAIRLTTSLLSSILVYKKMKREVNGITPFSSLEMITSFKDMSGRYFFIRTHFNTDLNQLSLLVCAELTEAEYNYYRDRYNQ